MCLTYLIAKRELSLHEICRVSPLQRVFANLLIGEAFVHISLAGKRCPLLLKACGVFQQDADGLCSANMCKTCSYHHIHCVISCCSVAHCPECTLGLLHARCTDVLHVLQVLCRVHVDAL